MVLKTETGMSSLRIEPVRNADNDTEISCVADNGVGMPIEAKAKLLLKDSGNMKLRKMSISDWGILPIYH